MFPGLAQLQFLIAYIMQEWRYQGRQTKGMSLNYLGGILRHYLVLSVQVLNVYESKNLTL